MAQSLHANVQIRCLVRGLPCSGKVVAKVSGDPTRILAWLSSDGRSFFTEMVSAADVEIL
jgi:hypothetical protein